MTDPITNIVDYVLEERGLKPAELADLLTELTGHNYTPQHVSNWKAAGQFSPLIANVVAFDVMGGKIRPAQACPQIKERIAATG